MKKFSLLMVVVLIVAALPAMTIGAQEEPLKVAVVMPSTINDLAFSQSMYDALVAIQEDMGEDAFQFDYSRICSSWKTRRRLSVTTPARGMIW